MSESELAPRPSRDDPEAAARYMVQALKEGRTEAELGESLLVLLTSRRNVDLYRKLLAKYRAEAGV